MDLHVAAAPPQLPAPTYQVDVYGRASRVLLVALALENGHSSARPHRQRTVLAKVACTPQNTRPVALPQRAVGPALPCQQPGVEHLMGCCASIHSRELHAGSCARPLQVFRCNAPG